MFPTAIAIKGSSCGGGGSGSGRPPVGQKPSYLRGGAGQFSHLSAKRGAEDLDYFIGAEASARPLPPGTEFRGSVALGSRLYISIEEIADDW